MPPTATTHDILAMPATSLLARRSKRKAGGMIFLGIRELNRLV
jgi:hypothetical protein